MKTRHLFTILAIAAAPFSASLQATDFNLDTIPSADVRADVINFMTDLGPQISLPGTTSPATASPNQLAAAVAEAIAANPTDAATIVGSVLAVNNLSEAQIEAVVSAAAATLPADQTNELLNVVKVAAVLKPTFAADIATAAARARPDEIASIGAVAAMMVPSQAAAISSALIALAPDRSDQIAAAIENATESPDPFASLASVLPVSVQTALNNNPSNISGSNNPSDRNPDSLPPVVPTNLRPPLVSGEIFAD